MLQNNDGLIRLVRELLEQIDGYQKEVIEPSLKNQPYNVGDDLYDIYVTCRKAKKLLALHDREVTFEEDCEKAFKDLERQKFKIELDSLHPDKLLRGVTVEEISGLVTITNNLANLLRKALFGWKSLKNS